MRITFGSDLMFNKTFNGKKFVCVRKKFKTFNIICVCFIVLWRYTDAMIDSIVSFILMNYFNSEKS